VVHEGVEQCSAIISIESPAAFRESSRKLKKIGISAREKRESSRKLKKKSLSAKERKELQGIARIPLPGVARKTAAKKRAT
jgi:hypothetical protein